MTWESYVIKRFILRFMNWNYINIFNNVELYLHRRPKFNSYCQWYTQKRHINHRLFSMTFKCVCPDFLLNYLWADSLYIVNTILITFSNLIEICIGILMPRNTLTPMTNYQPAQWQNLSINDLRNVSEEGHSRDEYNYLLFKFMNTYSTTLLQRHRI